MSTDRLRLHLDTDIENLDPAFQPNNVDYMVAYNVFENLVAYEPDTLELVNELAETWEQSEDGLRWDFKLKEGVHFHDGYGELTAEDVKFSFERIAGLTDPQLDSPYKSDWAALKEVKVTGKYTGAVLLNHTYAPLMTTTIPLQAGQIVSKKAVLELGDKFATKPIGTGCYEFGEWTQNQSVTLKKFKDYSGSADYAPTPAWGDLEFLVIPEANSAEVALESGQLDFAEIRPTSLGRFRGMEELDTFRAPTLNYGFIGMNVQHENLQDKNVRLAIRYGIDVPAVLQAAWGGRHKRANSLLAPGMPIGHWGDAPVYKRDVKKASEYLEKAGARGRKISMAFSPAEVGSEAVAQVVQQNLREIGLDVELLAQEHSVFSKTTPEANRQRQLFYTNYTTNADPHWATVWFTCDQVGSWNWMSWCNKEYSRLEEQAVRTQDGKRRQDLYVRMQQIMDQDAIAVWLTHPVLFYAGKKGVRPSVRPDGRFVAWNFRPRGTKS